MRILTLLPVRNFLNSFICFQFYLRCVCFFRFFFWNIKTKFLFFSAAATKNKMRLYLFCLNAIINNPEWIQRMKKCNQQICIFYQQFITKQQKQKLNKNRELKDRMTVSIYLAVLLITNHHSWHNLYNSAASTGLIVEIVSFYAPRKYSEHGFDLVCARARWEKCTQKNPSLHWIKISARHAQAKTKKRKKKQAKSKKNINGRNRLLKMDLLLKYWCMAQDICWIFSHEIT